MMELFEGEEVVVNDWWAVCPNAQTVVIPDEEAKLFDTLRSYTRDYDRAGVSRLLRTLDIHPGFLNDILCRTYPKNAVLSICATDFGARIPHPLFCDILALAHNGSGGWIKFPPKKQKPIPKGLCAAFGIRGDQRNWAHRLAENRDFVRSVAASIPDKAWSFIPYDREELLREEKRDTASHPDPTQGVIF